jgi:hypothetical protein
MSVQDLPPLKAVHVDDGALSYLIKPEGSQGMGLRLTINPDGSMLLHPLDPRISGFSLDSEAGKILCAVLEFHTKHTQNTFNLAS